MTTPTKRNLIINRPLGKNNFSKRVWAVKFFKMPHQRQANRTKYFDIKQEQIARNYAMEHGGFLYKDIKLIR